jgi:hypothetical protein
MFPIGNGEWSPETNIVGFVIGYDEAGGSVTAKVPSRPAITYTVVAKSLTWTGEHWRYIFATASPSRH